MDTHPYVKLAVEAVHYFLLKRKLLPCPSPLPPDMDYRAGTFISIKMKSIFGFIFYFLRISILNIILLLENIHNCYNFHNI